MTTHAPTTQIPRAPVRKAVNNKQEQVASALRAALSMQDHSEPRWRKLIEEGATDEEITHHLVDEFGSGGSSQTEGGIQYAYKGLPEPLFWLNASTHYTTMKPTLQGKSLIRRVREVLSIPQERQLKEGQKSDVIYPKPEAIIEQLDEAPNLNTLERIISGYKLDDLEKSVYCAPVHVEITREAIERARQRLTPVNESQAADEGADATFKGRGAIETHSTGAANMRAASSLQVAKPKKSDAHEFKPTTSRSGRCSVCNKGSDTDEHRAFAEEQRERMRAGQPKQTAEGWREKAAGMYANVTRYRANPHAGKKLTDARQRDWESKLLNATTHRRWGLTMEAIAAAVESGKLPPVLNGLTNQYQVRHLMDCVIKGRRLPAYGLPQSMGPTIKTAEEFAEAVKALSPLVPVVSPYTVDGELQGYGAEGQTEPATLIEAAPTDAAVIETPAPPVAEVFYALDLYEDKTHDVTYLGRDSSVDVVDEDSTAVIGVNSAGEKRVVSTHNINLTNADILTNFCSGAKFDEPIISPHAYRPRDSETDPCCIYPESDPIHDLTPATETPSDSLQTQAEAVTAAPAPAGEPFTKEIEVALNDHDIAQKARAAAQLSTEIAELEAEKKETDAAYKKKIGGKEEERDKLLSEIGRGRASLELKVFERRDYEAKVVELRRYDSCEVVSTRPMNPREYQQPLPSL